MLLSCVSCAAWRMWAYVRSITVWRYYVNQTEYHDMIFFYHVKKYTGIIVNDMIWPTPTSNVTFNSANNIIFYSLTEVQKLRRVVQKDYNQK